MTLSKVSGDKLKSLRKGPVLVKINRTRVMWKRGSSENGRDDTPVGRISPAGLRKSFFDYGLMLPGCEIQFLIDQNFNP